MFRLVPVKAQPQFLKLEGIDLTLHQKSIKPRIPIFATPMNEVKKITVRFNPVKMEHVEEFCEIE